jgi:hypothetical protein
MHPRRAKARPSEEADGATGASEDALHGAAMLRLALELKKPGAASLDALVAEVARAMRLHEPAFRRFLAQQGELFTALATGRG